MSESTPEYVTVNDPATPYVVFSAGMRTEGRETFRFVEGDLADEDLADLVMLRLGTWRRATDDDPVSPGEQLQGWFADAAFGSRIWLLARRKMSAAVLADAKTYTLEALADLIADGIAATIDVEVEAAPKRNGVHLLVLIARPKEPVRRLRYAYLWGLS